MKKLSVAATLDGCRKARPFLKPFLDAFEPLLERRRHVAEKLAPALAEAGIEFTGSPKDKPLIKVERLEGLAPFIRVAAGELLPLILEQPALANSGEALEKLFLSGDNDGDLEALPAAYLADDPEILIGLANKYDLQPQVLDFACGFILSAVFRALRARLATGDYPDWRKGVCPVCGMPPIIAWLDRKPVGENNEFLADGGGRKRLYCGFCGADWRVLRGVCPACGTQGEKAMRILGEEDRRHERVDWCQSCRRYLPQIDLRELADDPDMDALALGLMHLDLAAADKDLAPMKASFWNTY